MCDAFALILCSTAAIFGDKKWELSMGKPTESTKEKETQKSKNWKILFLTLPRYLKNTFLSVITFQGKVFQRKTSFSPTALLVFPLKFVSDVKLHVNELEICQCWTLFIQDKTLVSSAWYKTTKILKSNVQLLKYLFRMFELPFQLKTNQRIPRNKKYCKYLRPHLHIPYPCLVHVLNIDIDIFILCLVGVPYH